MFEIIKYNWKPEYHQCGIHCIITRRVGSRCTSYADNAHQEELHALFLYIVCYRLL